MICPLYSWLCWHVAREGESAHRRNKYNSKVFRLQVVWSTIMSNGTVSVALELYLYHYWRQAAVLDHFGATRFSHCSRLGGGTAVWSHCSAVRRNSKWPMSISMGTSSPVYTFWSSWNDCLYLGPCGQSDIWKLCHRSDRRWHTQQWIRGVQDHGSDIMAVQLEFLYTATPGRCPSIDHWHLSSNSTSNSKCLCKSHDWTWQYSGLSLRLHQHQGPYWIWRHNTIRLFEHLCRFDCCPYSNHDLLFRSRRSSKLFHSTTNWGSICHFKNKAHILEHKDHAISDSKSLHYPILCMDGLVPIPILHFIICWKHL